MKKLILILLLVSSFSGFSQRWMKKIEASVDSVHTNYFDEQKFIGYKIFGSVGYNIVLNNKKLKRKINLSKVTINFKGYSAGSIKSFKLNKQGFYGGGIGHSYFRDSFTLTYNGVVIAEVNNIDFKMRDKDFDNSAVYISLN